MPADLDFASELAKNMTDAAGNAVLLGSGIGSQAGALLRSAVQDVAPDRVLEVGLANAVSTLYILDALPSGSGKSVTSIDPFQATDWHDVGVANIARYGFADRHRLLREPDYKSLPELLRAGERFAFAYVDGDHSVDHTLLDFFYIDKMLLTGGVVGFNDTHLLTVQMVVKFIQTHRGYEEVSFGGKPAYAGRGALERGVRRVLRWQTQDRYFRKVSDWCPGWEDVKTLPRYAHVLTGRARRGRGL